ncbi:hypothetical protein DFJ58DRAFT_892581 [Suillus subalutaceus]|uniref:uncharacterized protein n=1 Tax=Suillus subalutaceus TaxID=48586 RepID=UPI001B872DEF|nr:uncharacterized protein DFJ58DRAFT_892581 [Suillus subalutaceus]KAG1871255.1 hypothetical protein DFJ58DRAFT_892581 [Suillus subalutaceus]
MRRADQVSASSRGLGKHFISPRKSRDKRKTQTFVNIPGADIKRCELALCMEALVNASSTEPTAAPALNLTSSNVDMTIDRSNDGDEWVYESDHDKPELQHQPFLNQSDKMQPIESQCRILSDKTSQKLYGNWTGVIPTLIEPFLTYLARTFGQPLEKSHSIISACITSSCAQKRTTVVCLFFDRFVSTDVLSCNCFTLSQVLICHGSSA